MAREVTIKEAAALLGVSVKTIERRIHDGVIRSDLRGNRRYVTIEEADIVAAPAPAQETDVQIASLKAELDAVRSERDNLRQMAQSQQVIISQHLQTINRLVETLQLPAPRQESIEQPPPGHDADTPAPAPLPPAQRVPPASPRRKRPRTIWERLFGR
jgi:excisionase family DNA binding protein